MALTMLTLLCALAVCGLLYFSALCLIGQVRRARPARGPRLVVVRPSEAPELQVPSIEEN